MAAPTVRLLHFENIRARRPRVFHGWWIVAAGFLGAFTETAIAGYTFSTLIRPMALSLEVSTTGLVFGLTLASITSALVSIGIGPVVDRYGARILVSGGALVVGVLLLAISQVTELWQFYLLFGLGIGGTRPILSQVVPAAAVANWFRRKRVQAFTIMSLSTSLSGVVLPPLAGVIVALYGWRSTWIVLVTLPWLLVAPVAWLFIRRRPEDIGLQVDGDPVPLAVSAAPLSDEAHWSRREVLRTQAFWLLLLSQLLLMAPLSSIIIHIVPFAQDQGFDLSLATGLLSLYALGAASGRPVWAWVTRLMAIRRALVIYAFTYGVTIALVVAVAMLTLNPVLLVVSMVGMGIAAGGGQQLQFQAWADYFGRDVIGSVVGFATAGQTLTVALSPLFLALVRDSTGSYLAGFAIFAVFCLTAAIAAGFAQIPHRRVPATAQA